MKHKTIWLVILILLVICIVSANIVIFSGDKMEDWVKNFLYERVDKNFNFEILNASWSEYTLRDYRSPDLARGVFDSPIDWDSYCADCKKRYVNCMYGNTIKCGDSDISCETNSWILKTNASSDLLCHYKIDGKDIGENKIKFGEGVGMDNGLSNSKTVSYLGINETHYIEVCCVSDIYSDEEEICRSATLPVKCEEPEGYCGDNVCNSKWESCKNCPSDCGICEEYSKKYWYEACIEGKGDLVYNENILVLESELTKKIYRKAIDKDEIIDAPFNCKLFELSIGNELVFRLDVESRGILSSYDPEEDIRIKTWNTFTPGTWALNKRCILLDPNLSFNCTTLHLFK